MNRVQTIVEQDLNAILEDGFHLYDVKVKSNANHQCIEIFVDRKSGLSLDDCSLLHRKFKKLDEEREGGAIYDDYQVIFSSPGIERNLRFPIDFELHEDKVFTFVQDSGETVQGKVLRLDPIQQNIEVETKQGLVKLEWKNVKRARFAPVS